MRKRLAKRLALLSRIERRGDGVIRRFGRDFTTAAVQALDSGRFQINTDAITGELADLMAEAYVRRYKQEKDALNLSFAKQVSLLARRLDLDLDDIRNAFVRVARRKVREATDSIGDRINRELSRISSEQLPTRQATRELRRSLDRMGLTPRNPSLVETLVRTHSQIAFGAAQWKLDQDDPQNLIWGYTYVTVGDSRVREEHAELDGLVRPKDDPIWETIWPPNGYNCRCQVLTLTDPAEPSDLPDNWRDAVNPGFDFNPGTLLN